MPKRLDRFANRCNPHSEDRRTRPQECSGRNVEQSPLTFRCFMRVVAQNVRVTVAGYGAASVLFSAMRSHVLHGAFFLLLIALPLGLFLIGAQQPPTPRIGATALVTEVTTGLTLEARVDTGAASCSVHFEKIEIENASEKPEENVGRQVRCLMKNSRGETAWLETEITGYSGVRTTSELEDRYFVNLSIRVNGVEEAVRTSLNDRTDMTYPFLVGRNFLQDRFIVDVGQDRRLDTVPQLSSSR